MLYNQIDKADVQQIINLVCEVMENRRKEQNKSTKPSQAWQKFIHICINET